MDQGEFILQNLGIDKNNFGRIYSFIDFGNVNHWYDRNTAPFEDGKIVTENQKIIIDIEKFGNFVDLFSKRKFFYYGVDLNKPSSLRIKYLAEKIARFKIIAKPIQTIKHYIVDRDFYDEQRLPYKQDGDGKYVFVRKCNFDVEIAVDVLRLADNYDTLVLFSSDSDFVTLLNYVQKLDKKVILFYSGHTSSELKNLAYFAINSQRIRSLITRIK